MFYAVANTILRKVKAGAAPVISFIWNLNTNLWNAESRSWGTYTPPPPPPPPVTTSYSFTMTDTYGDGWNGNQLTIEKFNGTSWVACTTPELLYNPSDLNAGNAGTSNLTLINSSGPSSIDIDLETGESFRLIVSAEGGYPEEPGYQVFQIGNPVAVFTFASGQPSEWSNGTVHYTFTA